MLVWLAEYLVKYHTFFNVFSYLTFRAIVGLLTALIIALWMGPHLSCMVTKKNANRQWCVTKALSHTLANVVRRPWVGS